MRTVKRLTHRQTLQPLFRTRLATCSSAPSAVGAGCTNPRQSRRRRCGPRPACEATFDRTDRLPPRAVIAPVIEDHPNRPLTDFLGKPRSACHAPPSQQTESPAIPGRFSPFDWYSYCEVSLSRGGWGFAGEGGGGVAREWGLERVARPPGSPKQSPRAESCAQHTSLLRCGVAARVPF
jgi:hypothetical protein